MLEIYTKTSIVKFIKNLVKYIDEIYRGGGDSKNTTHFEFILIISLHNHTYRYYNYCKQYQ
jgi:hypothetical protein